MTAQPSIGGELVVVGMSHHTAPIEVREELEARPAAFDGLAVIAVSTCNRLELYAWDEGDGRALESLQTALAACANASWPAIHACSYEQRGDAALLHLIRVVAGLDSLVVGEEQIRGQVRDALAEAQTRGKLPPALNGLFRRAFEVARRIRAQAPVGSFPSVAAAGIALAEQQAAIRGKCCLVLGAGAMAKSAATALQARGAQVLICNRTLAHGEKLVAQLGDNISVLDWSSLPQALVEVDLVVGSTAARQPVLNHANVSDAMTARQGRPLVLLDVAMPRDVEAAVGDLEGVSVIDLETLEHHTPVETAERAERTSRAEAIALEGAGEIGTWLRMRAASPLIATMREEADRLVTTELETAAVAAMPPAERAAFERATRSIVRKMLHAQTVALREAVTLGSLTPDALHAALRLNGSRSTTRTSPAEDAE